MMTTSTLQPHDISSNKPTPLSLILGSVLLLSFGATMLLISLTYVHDMRTLRELPNAVWNFICGKPQENQVLLPLLVLLSFGSFMAAGGLWAWRWLSKKLGGRGLQ
jgi:hypothetical protein